MKLYLNCMQCSQESHGATHDGVAVEYTEEGFYFFECKQGHKNFIMLQEERFETLFQIGANALMDGYYREAVNSFTTSLERFYEFCTKVFCKKNNITNDVFDKNWKFIAKSSERQFGCFLFLYLIEFKEPPLLKKDEDSWRNLRNEMVHNGKIPTREEALKYGEEVRQFILKTILKLQQEYSNEIQSLISENLQSKVRNNVFGCNNTTLCNGNIISLVNGEIEKELEKDFSSCLHSMKAQENAMKRHYC